MHVCMLSHLSCVQSFETLWTIAPLSVWFSRQEYWSGLPCPSPGDFPNPGIKPASLISPALAGRFFTTSATWEVLVPNSITGKYQFQKSPGKWSTIYMHDTLLLNVFTNLKAHSSSQKFESYKRRSVKLNYTEETPGWNCQLRLDQEGKLNSKLKKDLCLGEGKAVKPESTEIWEECVVKLRHWRLEWEFLKEEASAECREARERNLA